MTGSDRTVRNTSRNTNTVSSGRMAQTCQLLGTRQEQFPGSGRFTAPASAGR